MLFSGAWGKMFHEKKPEAKISWPSPFNPLFQSGDYLLIPGGLRSKRKESDAAPLKYREEGTLWTIIKRQKALLCKRKDFGQT
jgi:hypothetical protein